MYTTMLEPTTITSKKKLHLARQTMLSVMEDMGVHADEVDAVGHWEGNTQHKTYAAKIPKSAVCALAGFYMGEQYCVPWVSTQVPAELQMQIFPFVEDALANLHQAPNLNYGTVNFLELLQLLRPYFWRVSGEYPPVKTLILTESHGTHHTGNRCRSSSIPWLCTSETAEGPSVWQCPRHFRQWPKEREALEVMAQSDLTICGTFSEAATQSAFVSLANCQRQSDTTINAVLLHCSQLLR
ncbi:hypothetical protein DFJ58DRAFT_219409 [Suillus subalutaceus]|uniref:uncharacterized protein n=1 Tax=Suillus subalutaceus TaxID=48586 RepID=UPI001B87D9EC|nr:uncharacterized protein DFJ58DRAFT_219409 [Suillus subalutaceus]KAG1834072.1 hypothetical protein DFJ58DRAFT_219409 [Suillus subalutaceus]